MRVRRKRGTEQEVTTYSCFVVSPEELKGQWKREGYTAFHAEFGGGKGQFIIQKALTNPDVDFLMVDMVPEIMIKALRKAEKAGFPKNLRFMLRHIDLCQDCFAKGEIDVIYLNFSDPWPKKKHAKRRLTHPQYLEKYSEILSEKGKLEMKTDNQSLFEYSIVTLAQSIFDLQMVDLDYHKDEPEDNIQTEYEQKFSKKGVRIYHLMACKNSEKG